MGNFRKMKKSKEMKIWRKKLIKTQNFMREKERYPSNNGKELQERILALWVKMQRRMYKKKELNVEQIISLQDIGMIGQTILIKMRQIY